MRNDNVHYHSLIGLASGERLGATCSKMPISRNREPIKLCEGLLSPGMANTGPTFKDSFSNKGFTNRSVSRPLGYEDENYDLTPRPVSKRRNALL